MLVVWFGILVGISGLGLLLVYLSLAYLTSPDMEARKAALEFLVRTITIVVVLDIGVMGVMMGTLYAEGKEHSQLASGKFTTRKALYATMIAAIPINAIGLYLAQRALSAGSAEDVICPCGFVNFMIVSLIAGLLFAMRMERSDR